MWSQIFLLSFLLRFHPKHSGKSQTKARSYSGRKDFNDSLLFMRVSTKQRSKEELRCLTIHQEPIHTSLEATNVILLWKDRLRQPIPHLRCADKEAPRTANSTTTLTLDSEYRR